MANDFTTDANCVALWRFESGALTTDDIGTNTLTNNGAAEDTTNYMEGACCADLNSGDNDYLAVADADLDAGFPFKSGDVSKVISMAMWIQPDDVTSAVVVSKWDPTASKKSFHIWIDSASKIRFTWYNTSAYEYSYTIPVELVSGQKYHLGIAFDGINKTLLTSLYDYTADTTTTHTEVFSSSYTLKIDDQPFVIGGWGNYGTSQDYDGLIDEVVVFKSLKTADDFAAICAGAYVLPPTEGTADFFVLLPHMEADVTATTSFYVPLVEVEASAYLGSYGTAEFEVPKPEIEAYSPYTVGFASFEVPLPKITATGGDTTIIDIPLVQVTATGFTGTVGTATLEVPAPGLSAESASASLTVPLLELAAAGLTGTVGTVNAEVPLIEISAAGLVETIGTASLSVPLVQLIGEGSKNTYGTVNVHIPLAKVTASAYVGTIGTASITVPIPDIEALGYAPTTGTASITVPLVSVIANATEAVILVQVDGTNESLTGYALALNLKTNGLTEYDNYPFNSFTYFNGQYLGASSSGIYVLGSDDDDGTAIDSKIQTGVSDEGTALRKAVEDAFLGLSAGGVMTAKVVTDGMISYDGSPITQRDDTLITERVKFGKGIRSRYLGLEVENSGGCDFTLESAELIAIPLTRKL